MTHSFTSFSLATLCRSVLLCFALLLAGLTSQAQTTNWTGGTNADWNIPGNWSLGTVPTATNDVVISVTAMTQPVLSTTAVAKSVVVNSGASLSILATGSLSINSSTGAGLTNSGTVVNSGSLVIGNAGSLGGFGLTNGGSFTNTATGSVEVNRSNDKQLWNTGTFTNLGQITIGNLQGTNFGIANEGIFNHEAGNIAISQANNSGIDNVGTVSVSAPISISTVTSGGPGRGIYNRNTFNNNAGGDINLDRCIQGILNENRFTNAGTITMGASSNVTTAITSNGASNSSGFFNNSTCTSLINIVSNSPITTSGGSFSNAGTIIERFNGTSNITTNTGVVQNLNGGTFTITTNTGVLTTTPGTIWTGCASTDWNTPGNWSGATVPIATDDVTIPATTANQPIIGAGTTALARSVTLTAGSSLTVLASGILTIANSTTVGLTNDAGTLLNNGTIHIDGTGSTGVFSFSNSTITNAGVIDIGQSTSLGRHGILNRGVFTNTVTGRIRIDRIPSNPVSNTAIVALVNSQTTATFTNAGTITVGSSTSAGQDGVQNQNVFRNLASGRIYVDRTWGNGVWNTSSAQLFENAGLIVLGANAPTGISGILNDKPFTNLAGGDIQINRPSGNGIENRGSTGYLTNNGRIQVGLVASPGGHSIANIVRPDTPPISGTVLNGAGGEIIISPLSSLTASAVYNTGTFENQACAKLTIADNLFNNSVFTNAGLFTVNTTQVHSNTALTNSGTISYLQNSLIPNVTNNALILQSFTVCSSFSPALQAAVSNSLTVGTTWYKDMALTQPAGTYDQATNTFTVTNLAAPNSYTLYMAVTDAANACSYTAAIPVTTKVVPVIVLTPSPSSTLTCAQTSLTLTTNGGGSSYTFSPGTTPTGSANVVSVSVAGVYSVTVTNSVGCAGTASTTIVGSSAPLTASLIPGSSGVCSSGSVMLTASGGTNYAFSGPGLSQNGSSPTAVATQSGTYSVLVTGANGCTASASTSLTITIAPTPGLFTSTDNGSFVAQATGGVSYERLRFIDRINGYEIRQTEQNSTGYFVIDRSGPFSITVIGANGCRAVVNGVAP